MTRQSPKEVVADAAQVKAAINGNYFSGEWNGDWLRPLHDATMKLVSMQALRRNGKDVSLEEIEQQAAIVAAKIDEAIALFQTFSESPEGKKDEERIKRNCLFSEQARATAREAKEEARVAKVARDKAKAAKENAKAKLTAAGSELEKANAALELCKLSRSTGVLSGKEVFAWRDEKHRLGEDWGKAQSKMAKAEKAWQKAKAEWKSAHDQWIRRKEIATDARDRASFGMWDPWEEIAKRRRQLLER